MFWNLLADDGASNGGGGSTFLILLIVLVAVFVVYFFLSGRKGKQRQKEYIEQLEALAPGHKVKTIGGICGIVVEICDDNTVVIETGTELSGKSFLKIDKECIAQTDAKGPTQLAREELEAKRRAEKEAKNANRAPEVIAAPMSEEAPAQSETSASEEAPAESKESTQD